LEEAMNNIEMLSRLRGGSGPVRRTYNRKLTGVEV